MSTYVVSPSKKQYAPEKTVSPLKINIRSPYFLGTATKDPYYVSKVRPQKSKYVLRSQSTSPEVKVRPQMSKYAPRSQEYVPRKSYIPGSQSTPPEIHLRPQKVIIRPQKVIVRPQKVIIRPQKSALALDIKPLE